MILADFCFSTRVYIDGGFIKTSLLAPNLQKTFIEIRTQNSTKTAAVGQSFLTPKKRLLTPGGSQEKLPKMKDAKFKFTFIIFRIFAF